MRSEVFFPTPGIEESLYFFQWQRLYGHQRCLLFVLTADLSKKSLVSLLGICQLFS